MQLPNDYKVWILELKEKVRSSQIKAAITVNSALIMFYWDLGKLLYEKASTSQWGDKILINISKDLMEEFPNMKGLSLSNLKYCKRFYEYYRLHLEDTSQISQQAVDQLRYVENDEDIVFKQAFTKLPWGHNILIFTKSPNHLAAKFYIQQTIEHNWSRDVLDMQIRSDLWSRKGKAITNFNHTLPQPFSDLAIQTLKDPYVFDFLNLDEKYRERDIEKQLTQHISKFLLELGKGFAFVGQQYPLQIEENTYYIDLLFYHTKLKCFVVIELKNTKFIPEFAGKLNFYLSAVDSLIKDEIDNPTIGILLCKDKNNIEAEFALRDISKPIGISELKLVENLPESLKSSLPTIEEIENEFRKI
jgi:predicted nuclease of restriction endonuclease-like (RecB) superfamily